MPAPTSPRHNASATSYCKILLPALALLFFSLSLAPGAIAQTTNQEAYRVPNIASRPDLDNAKTRINRLLQLLNQHVTSITNKGKLVEDPGFTYTYISSFELFAPLPTVWEHIIDFENYSNWVSVRSKDGIVRFRGIEGDSQSLTLTLFLFFGGVFQIYNAYPLHITALDCMDTCKCLLFTFHSDESILSHFQVDSVFRPLSKTTVLVEFSIGISLDWKKMFLSDRFILEQLIPKAAAPMLSLSNYFKEKSQ